MSRCFPYPPPGYLGKGERGEAVRDPIKLKKGKENPITELDTGNKKRKDKKGRKEKKDKKRKDKGNKEHGSTADKHKTSDKSLLPKGKEEEAERSDLTVEHEQPVRVLPACHSPDSSGRGNKRRSISKSRGNILRIRLPLQRDKEPDSSLRAERHSDCENAATVSQQPETRAASHQEKCQPVLSNSESVVRSVKGSRVADLKENDDKSHLVSLHKRERKIESLYKALTEDWVPPPLETDQNAIDGTWLHPSNKRDQVGSKRLKPSHLDQQCRESSNLWPRAGYIAEADVYALPYSVPF